MLQRTIANFGSLLQFGLSNIRKKIVDDSRCRVAGSDVSAAGVVLADGGEPEPGDVDAAVPVDAVSIQADVDGLLDASCVPMLVLVHALHAVPVGVVTSSPGVLGYR